MSAAQHTPWRVVVGTRFVWVQDSEGRTVIAFNHGDDSSAEANASRIVACVNACIGVDTDDLFETMLVMRCDDMHAESARADKAEAQRDELAAALSAFLRAPSIGSSGPGSVTIEVQTFNLDAARAALAKVTS